MRFFDLPVLCSQLKSLAKEPTKSLAPALAALRTEDHRAARTQLDSLPRTEPQTPAIQLLDALVLIMEDKGEDALPKLEKLCETQAVAGLAHHLLGAIAGQKAMPVQNAKACTHFQNAAKLYPDWVENLVLLGRYLYWTYALDQAIPVLKRALALAPDHAEADFLYISCLSAAGHEDALRSYLENKQTPPINIQDDVTLLHKTKKHVTFARYPTHQALQDDLPQALRDSVLSELSDLPRFINRDTKFFTLGSCFAGNLARALTKAGYACTNLGVGETVNSTYANKAIIEWVTTGAHADLENRFQDLLGNQTRESIRQAISNNDVFIYTLGVAPCFFDEETNTFILPKATELNARALAGRYRFRTTSVEENVANMQAILAALRALNPKLRIFISVSPVPLRATFERKSCVLADSLSKSILRIAADQVVAQAGPSVHYWPSFEIVKWIGGHTGPYYGTDDGCALHVAEHIVDMNIELFLSLFQNNTPSPPDKQ